MFPEFSWRQTRKFSEFATEVATVDIAQLRSNLFHAQERFRQHPLSLSHSQCPHIIQRGLGHYALEKVTEPPARHIHRARQLGDRCAGAQIGVQVFNNDSYSAVHLRMSGRPRLQMAGVRKHLSVSLQNLLHGSSLFGWNCVTRGAPPLVRPLQEVTAPVRQMHLGAESDMGEEA